MFLYIRMKSIIRTAVPPYFKRVFRLEAVRAGYKKARQERNYAVIVALADNITGSALEEDPKLFMWYDHAVTRMGGE